MTVEQKPATDFRPATEFRLGTDKKEVNNMTLDVLLATMKNAVTNVGLKKWGFKVSGELILNAALVKLGITVELWAEGELP